MGIFTIVQDKDNKSMKVVLLQFEKILNFCIFLNIVYYLRRQGRLARNDYSGQVVQIDK